MQVTVLVRHKSRNVDAVCEAVSIANRLQPDFEFAVEQVRWLPKGNDYVRPLQVLRAVKTNHTDKFVLAVISSPLRGDLFDFPARGMNLVSTAGWDKDFAPPPLAIYVLYQLADSVANFLVPVRPSHLYKKMAHREFRACIFNSTNGRSKFLSVLVAGYVCADCEARLYEFGVSRRQLDSLGRLLGFVRDFAIRKPRNIPMKVFIGHGRRKDWQTIRDHLTSAHGLTVEEFNVSPTAGMSTIERLTEMLESACLAILVMTPENQQASGKVNARQNVVHEIGLFQGKLGFPRAIIVKERAAEEFSNIKGLTYIPFNKGRIGEILPEIDRVLVRERVVPALTAPPK